jgi:hypothetical protein
MSKEAKMEMLKALGKGIISMVEANLLFQSNGKIILDLSSESLTPDPIHSIIEKIPEAKKHFITVISLGNGTRP